MKEESPSRESRTQNVTGQRPYALRRRVWQSEELFGGDAEVLVLHGEQLYRLRQTRHGKLILHK